MAILILDLPSDTKLQFNLTGTHEKWQAGFEQIEVAPLAVLEFTTEVQYMLRYYNSATGESYENKVAFPNETSSVGLDLTGKLENKRRKMEAGYDFYYKLVTLMNKGIIDTKQSEKLTKLWDSGKTDNINLATATVREQFSKLKLGK